MSTSKKIDNIKYDFPMGDVEKYFEHIESIYTINSGCNDYRMTAQDSYNISVPVNAGQFTRFKLTDSQMDIVDISQGYINLKVELEYDFLVKQWETGQALTDHNLSKALTTHARNACYFFLGFKSGSHLIKQYSIYSNGKPTNCKQLRSFYEQHIVYSSKAKEERAGRPGMYSVHKDVLKMRDCVCGAYIQQPNMIKNEVTEGGKITLDICIQVDDLLPLSAMTYFPRFACGELELEIMCELERNMVFCQVPFEEVLAQKPFIETKNPDLHSELTGFYGSGTYQGLTDAGKKAYDELIKENDEKGESEKKTEEEIFAEVIKNSENVKNVSYSTSDHIATAESTAPVIRALSNAADERRLFADTIIDTRFHQCGDYARSYIGLSWDETQDINSTLNTEGRWTTKGNSSGEETEVVTGLKVKMGAIIDEVNPYKEWKSDVYLETGYGVSVNMPKAEEFPTNEGYIPDEFGLMKGYRAQTKEEEGKTKMEYTYKITSDHNRNWANVPYTENTTDEDFAKVWNKQHVAAIQPMKTKVQAFATGGGQNWATQFYDCYVTIKPKNLKIIEAKSYIFGFNMKQEAKSNCMKMFQSNGNLTIPAQWIEHVNPPQLSNISNMKITTHMPLWQCGQLVMTFPNSPNQLTVSRNPYLKAVRCQIGNKLIPDKNMSTIDKAHAEMTLAALGFDSLFSAPKSLMTALAAKEESCRKFYPHHDDDSDYMFVVDLERNGNAVYHDGISGDNMQFLFDAEYINDTENPHYYAYDVTKEADYRFDLRRYGANIFTVSDAYWVFGATGGEFVKDFRAYQLTREKDLA